MWRDIIWSAIWAVSQTAFSVWCVGGQSSVGTVGTAGSVSIIWVGSDDPCWVDEAQNPKRKRTNRLTGQICTLLALNYLSNLTCVTLLGCTSWLCMGLCAGSGWVWARCVSVGKIKNI